MYFEPTKRTYRFPSTNSMNDYQSKYYYPDKYLSSNEDSRSKSKHDRYSTSGVNRVQG